MLNEKPISFGGWLESASKELSKIQDIELTIAFPKNGNKDVNIILGERIKYYSFPPITDKKNDKLTKNNYLKEIIERTEPDLVHIFGTEFSHTLAMVNICKSMNMISVISIQGLVSYISKHYMANLPLNVQNRFTVRDLIKLDNIKQQQNKFMRKGKNEVESLQKVNHIIGRTTWDKACTSQINPNAKYYTCNENLRDEFYKHKWDLNRCEKYSIYLSQGSYPIKGLHYMIEAMPEILKKYPDAKIYIGGADPTKSGSSLKERLKISSYGKYIKDLIKKYNLQKKVKFTGILNEKQMCERYLKAHVFVCPSSIENSPNSLGEAMLLGLPCVATDVGGISDLIKHNEEGFVYQSDAPYMLAYYVCQIFEKEEIARQFSKNARVRASKTHNIENNTKRLVEIYNDII